MGSVKESQPQPSVRLSTAASEVWSLTEPGLESLRVIGGAAEVDTAEWSSGPFSTDWNLVADAVHRTLENVSIVCGAGVAMAGTGAPSEMHWWVRRLGAIVKKRHVTNPESDSFYDFTQTRWFRAAARQKMQPTVFAPYVDSWGTDDVTMTAVTRVEVPQRVTLAVAVDLDARRYIDEVERILLQCDPATLIDGTGRVVASSDPQLETAVRVRPTAGSTEVKVPGLRWTLADRVEPGLPLSE